MRILENECIAADREALKYTFGVCSWQIIMLPTILTTTANKIRITIKNTKLIPKPQRISRDHSLEIFNKM
ncbi:conserved hypothetical protein [Leptospira interrogans serovar Manilae]|uniref:Uncharacterized protein n=2 Tax=Leptospira interrogans TaxID=173 RepID=A0AAQ1NYT9_LEPIR|nr:hypothetical protein [Leptospira interrogans]AKP24775.1 hypothetical protein LIMLP_01655 [Leptospira interrogans serovar Manilae]AKP28560.1 hypothetical protein LIMHP_01650 [Leptospira interrogans serovar Manilae]SOR60646.1 conserved hypothetical protein [Leptospira interrogans serovar Manilae]